MKLSAGRLFMCAVGMIYSGLHAAAYYVISEHCRCLDALAYTPLSRAGCIPSLVVTRVSLYLVPVTALYGCCIGCLIVLIAWRGTSSYWLSGLLLTLVMVEIAMFMGYIVTLTLPFLTTYGVAAL